MAPSIFAVFRHISFVSKVFGLMPLKTKASVATNIYTASWVVILMCVFVTLFSQSLNEKVFRPDPQNWLSSIIVQIRTILGGAMFVFMVAATPFRGSNLIVLLDGLRRVDEDFHIMSVSIPYRKEKRDVNIFFYCATAFIFAFIIAELVLKEFLNLDPVLETSNYMSLLVHFITQMQFVLFMLVLKRRFASLNKWISFYYDPGEKTPKNFYWVSPVGVTNSHLAVASRIHDELCLLAKKAEKTYAFRMLLIISQCFVIIVLRVYYISSSIYKDRPTKHLFSSLMGVMFDMVQILIILYATDGVSKESYKTAKLLHRLERSRRGDLHHKIDVALFSLQILHGRMRFSACGLFPLNFTLMQSIMGAVTTYLIIIVQFDITAQQNRTPIYGDLIDDPFL